MSAKDIGGNIVEKIVKMTAEEIRKNCDVKKALEMLETAPVSTCAEMRRDDFKPLKDEPIIAHGFDEFKEYIKKTGKQKVKKSKVS